MKQLKVIYRIASLFVALLLVIPSVVISMHMLLHHHNEKIHQHDIVTFCDKELKLCKYDNYTFTHFTLISFKFKYGYLKIINCVKKYGITEVYFRDLVSIKKGRAPPSIF